MTDEAVPAPAQQPLSWESLGDVPAARAFRASLVELMARPARFFSRMATTGGLHEPVTFFAALTGIGLLMAFPAALCYAGLVDGAGGAARVTGLLVATLPLSVAAGTLGMMLLGSLFHVAGLAFGARHWEGSLSVWLYAGAAALVPLVLTTAAVLVVALGGYLVTLIWEGAAGAFGPLTGRMSLILYPAAVLAGAIVLLVHSAVGQTRAFRLATVQGVAAGLAGTILVGAVVTGLWFAFARAPFWVGLVASGVAVCACGAVAVVGALAPPGELEEEA